MGLAATFLESSVEEAEARDTSERGLDVRSQVGYLLGTATA